MTEPTGTELAVVDGQPQQPPVPSAYTLPVITPQEAKAAMEAYQDMCEAVLDPLEDYQEYETRAKVNGRWQTVKKRFKKKSAVKKLQTFWGVEVTVLSKDYQDLGEGHFGWAVAARAVCRGRHVDETAACSTLEEKYDLPRKDDETANQHFLRKKKAMARAYHDVLATATTRATNRAVMNCIGVGGGEVTAEEMQGAVELVEAPRPARTSTPVAPVDITLDALAEARKKIHALCSSHKEDFDNPDGFYRTTLREDPAFAHNFAPDEWPTTKKLDYDSLKRFGLALTAHIHKGLPHPYYLRCPICCTDAYRKYPDEAYPRTGEQQL